MPGLAIISITNIPFPLVSLTVIPVFPPVGELNRNVACPLHGLGDTWILPCAALLSEGLTISGFSWGTLKGDPGTDFDCSMEEFDCALAVPIVRSAPKQMTGNK